MEEAEVLCDRLAIMDHGRILEMGTVDELVDRHFQERAVRFDRSTASTTRELGGAAGGRRRSSTTTARSSLYTARRAGDDRRPARARRGARASSPQNLRSAGPTLEDVFLDLTGRALRD